MYFFTLNILSDINYEENICNNNIYIKPCTDGIVLKVGGNEVYSRYCIFQASICAWLSRKKEKDKRGSSRSTKIIC